MKKIIYSLIAMGFLVGARAQQIPLYHQYQVAPLIFNPAFAGQDTTVNASLIHRTQWKGMVGAPQTSAFGFWGLSLMLVNHDFHDRRAFGMLVLQIIW